MQKVKSQYRSTSVPKAHAAEPESTDLESESFAVPIDPATKRDRRLKAKILRSKSIAKKQSETGTIAIDPFQNVQPTEEITKPRSVSSPRERAHLISQFRSRSESKARPTEKNASRISRKAFYPTGANHEAAIFYHVNWQSGYARA